MRRDPITLRLNAGQQGPLIILVLFTIMVGLLGGASRYDAVQIIPLRTVSALFLIPGLLYISWSALKQNAFLISSFAGLAILMVIQLVPLPADFWHTLPERDSIAQMDAMLGYEPVWRPLTLTPMRTSNALGSLIVPAAALVLAIAFSVQSRVLLHIIGGLGVASAILGLLQVMSGKTSPLYFYETTNSGSPVGIFANENHAAIFAACSLLVITRLGLEAQRERRGASWTIVYSVAFAVVTFVALISGSRAGFAACLGAMLISVLMVQTAQIALRFRTAVRKTRKNLALSRLSVLLPLLALGLIIGAFIFLNRSPAVEDIFAQDAFADLRWAILPTEVEMIKSFWLFGSGFGSFEQVYKMFESSDLLMPAYVNQAHNDFIQILIEGGAVAVMLLAVLVIWTLRKLQSITKNRANWAHVIFWISIFGIIGLASVIDYPMRTPIFQCVFVWLLIALSRSARGEETTKQWHSQ